MLTIQLIHETDEGKKIDFNQFARRMVSFDQKMPQTQNLRIKRSYPITTTTKNKETKQGICILISQNAEHLKM